MPTARTFPFRFVRSFIVFFLLCFTVAFLIMSKREFDEVTINQVLFHMQLMRDNIVTMPGDFIHVFFWHVKNAVLCAVTFAFLRESAPKRQGRAGVPFAVGCLGLAALWYIVPGTFIDDLFVVVRYAVVAALFVAAAGAAGLPYRVYTLVPRALHWLSGGWRLAVLWLGILAYGMYYVNFLTFFQEQAVIGDFYTEGAYVDPRKVTVSGTGTKNLIIIYCESIEETFGRSDVMGEDLLAPLRPSIEEPDLRIEQMPGADFTIGGIVASQCGIPLKSISILSGNLTGWALDRYLPGAVCLGDYLKADGYFTNSEVRLTAPVAIVKVAKGDTFTVTVHTECGFEDSDIHTVHADCTDEQWTIEVDGWGIISDAVSYIRNGQLNSELAKNIDVYFDFDDAVAAANIITVPNDSTYTNARFVLASTLSDNASIELVRFTDQAPTEQGFEDANATTVNVTSGTSAEYQINDLVNTTIVVAKLTTVDNETVYFAFRVTNP